VIAIMIKRLLPAWSRTLFRARSAHINRFGSPGGLSFSWSTTWAYRMNQALRCIFATSHAVNGFSRAAMAVIAGPDSAGAEVTAVLINCCLRPRRTLSLMACRRRRHGAGVKLAR